MAHKIDECCLAGKWGGAGTMVILRDFSEGNVGFARAEEKLHLEAMQLLPLHGRYYFLNIFLTQ